MIVNVSRLVSADVQPFSAKLLSGIPSMIKRMTAGVERVSPYHRIYINTEMTTRTVHSKPVDSN